MKSLTEELEAQPQHRQASQTINTFDLHYVWRGIAQEKGDVTQDTAGRRKVIQAWNRLVKNNFNFSNLQSVKRGPGSSNSGDETGFPDQATWERRENPESSLL